MASSKSRASMGSMVTIVSRVRSSRPRDWLRECVGLPAGLFQGVGGECSGRWNSRMIESVSTPGLPRGPSTSLIPLRRRGAAKGSGPFR